MKRATEYLQRWKEVSHPAWVCGLKQNYIKRLRKHLFVTPCVGVWIETTSLHGGTCCFPSHPAWVCGLKLAYQKIYYDFFVTPCVGVWIETVVNGRCYNFGGVTPCVGVWIETLSCHVNLNYLNVTPCVGVWIETDSVWSFDQLILSHPAWVCGLKPFVYDMISLRYGHTLRGCVD